MTCFFTLSLFNYILCSAEKVMSILQRGKRFDEFFQDFKRNTDRQFFSIE
jgi:hypothetical protein